MRLSSFFHESILIHCRRQFLVIFEIPSWISSYFTEFFNLYVLFPKIWMCSFECVLPFVLNTMYFSARNLPTNNLQSTPEWRCFLCNGVFPERKKLRQHVLSHHEPLVQSFHDGQMPYLHMCSICRVGKVCSKFFFFFKSFFPMFSCN